MIQINPERPRKVLHQPLATHISCGDCPIRHRAVCARCDAGELAELEAVKFYRSYPAGAAVVWAGEPMDFVASVVTGIATLTQTMEDGRRQMVGLLMASDFVGRPGRNHAAYDVTAVTDLVMCCFRKKPFEALILKTPHVAHRLLEMTLDELDAAREWMLLLGRKTAREKIASFLCILARREAALHKQAVSEKIILDLPLTRDELADYLGLTLETVSRQISALRRDAVLELVGKRGIVIPHFDKLQEISGDDGDGNMPS